MSTNFTLGLDILPEKELFQGMDRKSSHICGILQGELNFPRFAPAMKGATVWTSKKTGVIASIRYASADLVKAFEELTGVTGRLFISLQPDKQIPRDESLKILFATAKAVLLRTECDAAFNLEWDHVILRRIRGEIAVEDISHLFPHDSDALLQQLDMSDAPSQKSK